MDKFDEPVKVFYRHGLVLLVEVVDVAIENFDEQLNRYSGIHASISNAERSLEAFEYSFTIAIDLEEVLLLEYSKLWQVIRF